MYDLTLKLHILDFTNLGAKVITLQVPLLHRTKSEMKWYRFHYILSVTIIFLLSDLDEMKNLHCFVLKYPNDRIDIHFALFHSIIFYSFHLTICKDNKEYILVSLKKKKNSCKVTHYILIIDNVFLSQLKKIIRTY